MSSSLTLPPLLCGHCQSPAEKRCSVCHLIAYCSRECQKGDWKRHKREDCGDDEKEADEFRHGVTELKVEVGDSPVHGRGVFATEDIAKGERTCFFAGLDVSVRQRVTMVRHGGDSKEDAVGIKNASDVFGHFCRPLSDCDMYAKHHRKRDVVRIGDPDFDSDAFGVGQYVNDGSMPRLDELDFATGFNRLKAYLTDSEAKANVALDGPGYWFVASRPIERGEELFTHYGFEFWLHKMLLECKKDEDDAPAKRFFYYSLMDQRSKAFNLTQMYSYDQDTCREFLRIVLGDEERAKGADDPKWELLRLSERVNLR